jgi:hypothetical protein
MKIKYCTTNPQSSNSFYRCGGVLPKLRRLDETISAELAAQIDWDVLIDTDILFLQNPFDDNYFMAAAMAKELKVKLWLDYEDNILDVPVTHPFYKFFSGYAFKKMTWDLMAMADVVTVPTEALKKRFDKHCKNVIVVENAFNDYNYDLPAKMSENKIIQWRGSDTHWHNLDAVKEQLWEVAENNPDWVWNFMAPDEKDVLHVLKGIPNSQYTPAVRWIDYMRYIRRLSPGIQIHPLEDNEFNRCKAGVAWIEGTYSGAAFAMSPYLAEYAQTMLGLFDSLSEAIKVSAKERQDNFDFATGLIKNNLLLSEINKKRLKIAQELA